MVSRQRYGENTGDAYQTHMYREEIKEYMVRAGVNYEQFVLICREGITTLMNSEVTARLRQVLDTTFNDANYNHYVKNRLAFNYLIHTGQINVVFLAMVTTERQFKSPSEVIQYVRANLDGAGWRALKTLPLPWLQGTIKGSNLNADGTSAIEGIRALCESLGFYHRTETRRRVLDTLVHCMNTVDRIRHAYQGITAEARIGWRRVIVKLITDEFNGEGPMAPARIREDWSGVIDYLSRERIDPTAAQRWTWRSLQNRTERWHIGLQYRSVHDMPGGQWNSLFDRHTDDELGLWADALTSSEQLQAEGADMKHCVGGYTSRCVGNQSRIFAISGQSREDRSTLELCPDRRDANGPWYLSQNKGPNNRSPSRPARIMAERIRDRWNETLGLNIENGDEDNEH